MRLINADSFKEFLQALVDAGAPYEDVIKLLDNEPTVDLNDILSYQYGTIMSEVLVSKAPVNTTK